MVSRLQVRASQMGKILANLEQNYVLKSDKDRPLNKDRHSTPSSTSLSNQAESKSSSTPKLPSTPKVTTPTTATKKIAKSPSSTASQPLQNKKR